MRGALTRVRLAVAALIGVLAIVWWLSGTTTAATLATVVAAVLAATGPLAGWLPTRAAAQGTIDDRLERLATVVRVQWEREANVRRLHDPQPIAVHWTAADPRLMDHAEVIACGRDAPAAPAPAGRLEDVVEEFVRLPRRRLVVIGEPGAGKTGVLLLLTLGLLARRSTDPVPVLFSLASWNPARIGLSQWLARHLSDEYPFVRPREAHAIIEAGRVIPLLDGLDELPAGVAAAAVEMINEAWLQRPLVVACRTQEFARAVYFGDVLTGAAVVELQPVRPEQAETYLRLSTPRDDRLSRWEPVFAELRRDPSGPVATALSTPLMVTLARTVYALDRSADPTELVRCPSREAIEDSLLDALVPALYAGYVRWSAGRSRAWLGFLAAHLRWRGTRDLAWWELAPGRALSQIARALGLGLAGGFVFGLLGIGVATDVGEGIPPQPVGDILIGLLAGLTIALMAGVGAAIAIGLSLVRLVALRGPSRLVIRFDWSLLRRLLIGAVTGILIVIPSVLVLALLSPPGFGSVVAQFALMLGLPLGLGFALLRPSERPPTPSSSLASNRLVSIITLLVAGLPLALAAAGSSLYVGASLSTTLSFVGLGLGFGVPTALGMAAVLPWSAYQLVHIWLALRGRLPWRLLAFLEDAHQRGLLRQVGGVYQFRHARLQDRLAGR